MKKAMNHSALLNKKVQGEIRKAEEDLASERKQLSELEGGSLMLRLKELLKKTGRGEEGRSLSELRQVQKAISEER